MSPEEIAEAVADRMEGVITCKLYDVDGCLMALSKVKLGAATVGFNITRSGHPKRILVYGVEIWRHEGLHSFMSIGHCGTLNYDFDATSNPGFRDILRQGLQPQEAVD